MRHLSPSTIVFSFSLTFAGVATAGDEFCLGGNCPDVDAGVREALAEVGAPDIDSFTLVPRTDGSTSLVIAAHDVDGLQRVATLTGTQIAYIRGLETAFLEVPFSGATTLTIGGLQVGGGVAHTDKDMEPGVPSDCEVVCVCTDTGVDCWSVCP